MDQRSLEDKQTVSLNSQPDSEWRTALQWGFGIALLHRILLMLWMALVLVLAGTQAQISFTSDVDSLAPLTSPLEQQVFGVWRRWDTLHYFNLALNGYRVTDPGPTVFGPLTPVSFALFDRILPGGVDLAAMVVTTLAFALALSFLYRLTATYYDDSRLARWALLLTVLFPLSYYFAAPMSESIYLMLILAGFYWASRNRWYLAAGAAALAVLARSQGVFMAVVMALFFIQSYPLPQWRQSFGLIVRKGWAFAFIPIAFFGFERWRTSLGLPGLLEIYRDYSYVYITNPLDGLLTNLAVIAQNLSQALTDIDRWALVLTALLAVLMLRYPRHRRLPLLAYTYGYALLFVSKLNYFRGTTVLMGTQSYARYTLTLFPLFILAADGLRRLPRWSRTAIIIALLLLLLLYSGLHALGIGPA